MLRGYAKTRTLAAGEAQVLPFTLTARDMAVWDSGLLTPHTPRREDGEALLGGWTRVGGRYRVHAAASSADLRLHGDVDVPP